MGDCTSGCLRLEVAAERAGPDNNERERNLLKWERTERNLSAKINTCEKLRRRQMKWEKM